MFGKMSSPRLDSHRNSVQNGMVESFPALTATISVNFLLFPKCSLKNVDRKTHRNRTKGKSDQKADYAIRFSPRFCAEWSRRELPSSHGDYFRELFGVLLRVSVSGRSQGNLWEVSTIIEKLSKVLGRLQKVPGNVDFTIGF